MHSKQITPEFKSQLQGYLQLLRQKIKQQEQTIVEIQMESDQLKDDLESSMKREMLLIDQLRAQPDNQLEQARNMIDHLQ